MTDGFRFTVVPETGVASGTTARTGLRLPNPGSPTDRRRQPFCTYMTAVTRSGVLRNVRLHHLDRR